MIGCGRLPMRRDSLDCRQRVHLAPLQRLGSDHLGLRRHMQTALKPWSLRLELAWCYPESVKQKRGMAPLPAQVPGSRLFRVEPPLPRLQQMILRLGLPYPYREVRRVSDEPPFGPAGAVAGSCLRSPPRRLSQSLRATSTGWLPVRFHHAHGEGKGLEDPSRPRAQPRQAAAAPARSIMN